jgi:hypothetical protein
MWYIRTALPLLTLVLGLTTVATADIYRYRGPDGRLIISNMPPPPSAAVERSRRETVRPESDDAAQTTPSPAAQAPASAAAPAPVVVVKEVPARNQRPTLSATEYRHRYDEAHRKYSHLHGIHLAAELRRHHDLLLKRDTLNNSVEGREAIAECERKYSNDRSQLACMVVHYGG